jgi:hypothetical protein
LPRELFTVVFVGRNSDVMPGVQQALGRNDRFMTHIKNTLRV